MVDAVYTGSGQEYSTTTRTYSPLPPHRGFMLKALLGVLASLIVAVLVSTNAYAQDMSAQLEEFNATCFTEQGEFEPTDGCYEYAESLGLEIENINESMDKGCVLSDLFEDYSCKGPSAPSSSSVSEQGNPADTGCVAVDMTDPEVSGQDIDILTKYFGFDARLDNDELLYSPECFEQGIVPFDFESMQNNPCYDVLSDSTGSEYWVEYLGCPDVPVTQQGTYAPLNWRDRVVELKPATSPTPVSPSSKVSSTSKATTSSLSTTNPYQEHRDGDTGRSQGQVVSESKRAEVHEKASRLESKLKAQEKSKKASSKQK
jgi:hypothetical protein